MAKKKAKRTAKKEILDPTLPIFQLKISLDNIAPAIWRRVEIGDCSLHDLHAVIQECMGWDDAHPHVFNVGGDEFGSEGDFEYDSRSAWLSRVLGEGHTKFRYEYDFGDDWQHTVEIEKTLPAEEGARYPRCLAGARACPPEDCGGPYGYPEFLERLEDSEEEGHEELRDMLGDFDPEAFDVDRANRILRSLRRWLGRRKGPRERSSVFSKGDLVRVKAGTPHDEYPDIPLGGWVGVVRRVGWLTPIGYAVHWTKPTLQQAPAVYFKRCKRDYEAPHRIWLDEDQLEAAASETPEAMEQPTQLATPPLSPEEPLDRIRMVFGLTADDPLPGGDESAYCAYVEYLRGRLSFPFEAGTWASKEAESDETLDVTVVGFADPAVDPKTGILCEVRAGSETLQIPLQELSLDDDDPNQQAIEDYRSWHWEVKYELEDDDEETDGSVPYPIGTLAYYGPDGTTTTKIVAAAFEQEGAEAILERWVASDVTTNPRIREEIEAFFERHGVKQVVASEGNMGCPHEEGEDFPEGGDCPFCPWWKGKQGSGLQEEDEDEEEDE
jgi:hypothetical protein